MRWAIGSEPKRWAYIWDRPQGSKREGISRKSLPANIRWASVSSKPMRTPTEPAWRRARSAKADS